MNKNCEKYREILLDHIVFEDINEMSFSEHHDECPECKKFLKKIEEIQNNLQEIGEHIKSSLPEIDIEESIIAELSKINNEEQIIHDTINKDDTIPEFVEWNSYIENEINDISQYKCEIKLEQSLHLKNEIQKIHAIHNTLSYLGETWKAPQLSEDLLPSIIEKVEQYKKKKSTRIDSIEQLEEEILEISTTVTPILNTIDISNQIVEKIKSKEKTVRDKDKRRKLTPITQLKQDTDKSITNPKTQPPRRYYLLPLTIAAILILTLLAVFINFSLNQIKSNKKINTALDSNTVIKSKTNNTYKTTPPFYQMNHEQVSPDKEITAKNNNGKSTLRKDYVEGALSVWTNQLKENALANAGKLMRMGVWATLSPEEARELLQKSGLSPEAVLGAVQFLPPDEARVVLQAAIDNNPNDAYLRYAMVQTLMKLDSASDDEIYSQLTTWSQLDPSNALPHFIEAELYLKNGLTDKAINCITDANSTTNYNSYSSITAKAYMEALLAKGVDPEMAKLLASASMGLRETQDFENMVQTLLDYGKYYEDIGDYETALLIYEALRNLGVKVDTSSVLIQERLVGLEYAQKAINAMIRIMSSTNNLSNTQSLINFTQALNELMTNYNLALDNFYRLFDTDNPALILDVLNTYLTRGNIATTSR